MSTLSISLIQTQLHWEDVSQNLSMLAEKIRAIEKTEVVVLPEMFSTGFSMKPEIFAEPMDGPTVTWMRDLAAEKRIIITGSLMIRENGRYFNRLIWMLPNGQVGYYDKRHLFGYAGEQDHYSAGSQRLIAQVKGWKINLQVCYDLRFPVWARQKNEVTREGETSSTSPEYDLLIYVANWPKRRNHAWKTLLQARAIENQCFVIGVNRVGNDGNDIYHSGDSMVVDPMGEVLISGADEEFVQTVTLDKEKLDLIREKFPFLQDRDSFNIGL